jgi:hypothetical protein
MNFQVVKNLKTQRLNSAVAEGTPFPKGPPKSSVRGTPGWNLLSSARRYGWPPLSLDRSVHRDFRPGQFPASRGSGVAMLSKPSSRSAGCTVTLVLRGGVSLTSYSHIVQRDS